MKKILYALAALCTVQGASAKTFVETPAYIWRGDTIIQGEFFATAPSGTELISTYSAQPGYFMPVDKHWSVKNDISAYPHLITPNTLHTALYNLALDEMVNAVEPDTTLRTGREWPGVWTRDVSYSILLSMAYMQPEATRISLMRKVDREGRIIQDTGSGGAWPISTDRMIWAVAAYELYKVTGDREWLEYIYKVIKRSLEDDRASGFYEPDGLVRGETSFIDWREQSYPKWMQTADIYQSQALGTSVIHAEAWKILSEIATELGKKDVASDASAQARRITDAINRQLWLDDKGYYAMYTYGRDNLLLNPRAESLGLALSVLWDIADSDRARSITSQTPVTPFGVAVFYPQIPDMLAYHNNALWPWVASWWALANAKTRNEEGVMQAIGSVFRPAALFTTNKENLNLSNGDIATELNSSNMLWCLAGNIALTHKILFGIDFTEKGLAFHPFVPEVLGAERTLTQFPYRGAMLDITVSGYGDSIALFTVDGRKQAPLISPRQAAKAQGKTLNVRIEMANRPIASMKVNARANASTPITPIARLEGNTLVWQPIEYIDHYLVVRNGGIIDNVTTTTYDASVPGEYQVIGVSDSGIEGFASEPVSNRPYVTAEMPAETTEMKSREIAYQPTRAIAGFSGDGFVEIDNTTGPVDIRVNVPEGGVYSLVLRYANGNGPVNTENRCAIRTVLVDGKPLGSVVMPHRGRGNWSDWGNTNSLDVELTPGEHTVTIEFRPQNTNMNIDTNHALIDRVILTKRGSVPTVK